MCSSPLSSVYIPPTNHTHMQMYKPHLQATIQSKTIKTMFYNVVLLYVVLSWIISCLVNHRCVISHTHLLGLWSVCVCVFDLSNEDSYDEITRHIYEVCVCECVCMNGYSLCVCVCHCGWKYVSVHVCEDRFHPTCVLFFCVCLGLGA
jgi:hypothetical protein